MASKKQKKQVAFDSDSDSDNDSNDSNEDVMEGAGAYNPFDNTQTEEKSGAQNNNEKNDIHLFYQKRTARKGLTLVQGMPEDLDLHKICQAFKKMWHCNGNDVKDKKYGDII